MDVHPVPVPVPATVRSGAGPLRLPPELGSKTPGGKAAKLVANSLYGKLAQSVGRRPFGCLLYGGLITAGCRVQILDAIATHPLGAEGVVQIATDAATFLEPHPHLPLSDELGDWEERQHKNLLLFKPGCYWDDAARKELKEGQLPRFKARGISAKHFARHLPEIDAEFARLADAMASGEDRWWPKLTYETDFSLITPRMALHRSQWANAGSVKHDRIQQSSDPRTKRTEPYYDQGHGIIRSRPYFGRGRSRRLSSPWPSSPSPSAPGLGPLLIQRPRGRRMATPSRTQVATPQPRNHHPPGHPLFTVSPPTPGAGPVRSALRAAVRPSLPHLSSPGCRLPSPVSQTTVAQEGRAYGLVPKGGHPGV